MILENSGLEGIQNTFGTINQTMKRMGFYPSWDYHKVTFDLKLEEKGVEPEFYLRIPARVVEGSMDSPKCVLELGTPVIALHYYPHGLDYDAPVPEPLKKQTTDRVKRLAALLKEKSA